MKKALEDIIIAQQNKWKVDVRKQETSWNGEKNYVILQKYLELC